MSRNDPGSPAHTAGATGLESDQGQEANLLMAHGFRRNSLIARRFPPTIESSVVLWNPLESTPVVETIWRGFRNQGRADHIEEPPGEDSSAEPAGRLRAYSSSIEVQLTTTFSCEVNDSTGTIMMKR